MKKFVIFTTLIFVIASGSHAQINPSGEKSVMTKPTGPVRIKTLPAAPAPPPPPAASHKTTNTQTSTAPEYALTSVRVSIRTGSDNKEFPSQVHVRLMANATPANWRNYLQINLGNEMRVNSDTEFGLNVEGAPTSLEDYQRSGLKLSITYIPNFFADAWKIEHVSLILEFKDKQGNLHPTLGRKTIVFNNAYGFLNDTYRYLDCFTDGSFAPLTAVIRKL